MKITVIPIGSFDTVILRYLVILISGRFNTDTTLGSNVSIGNFKKDVRRDQYLSTNMLEKLSDMTSFDRDVLLGVTDVDLYVPSLNFVFGEADPYKRVSVISIARLRPSFYGLRDDEGLLQKRAGKEAVHELGHVFDLRHCTHPKCVMYFSNSLVDTDFKEDMFCHKCKKSLDIN